MMHRVKVYRLNNDGLWDDKGTGHVSVEYLEVRARRNVQVRLVQHSPNVHLIRTRGVARCPQAAMRPYMHAQKGEGPKVGRHPLGSRSH